MRHANHLQIFRGLSGGRRVNDQRDSFCFFLSFFQMSYDTVVRAKSFGFDA